MEMWRYDLEIDLFIGYILKFLGGVLLKIGRWVLV